MSHLLLLAGMYIIICLPLFAKENDESNGIVRGVVITSDQLPAGALTVQIIGF